MNIDVRLKDITYTIDKALNISFLTEETRATEELASQIIKMAETSKNGLEITIKKKVGKRSLDANAYLWVLCDKIAKELKSTKEEVYIEFIRRVGVFEVVPVKSDTVDKFIEHWENIGKGWFCEIVGKSKLEGYTNISTYYGSSVYDITEMFRLTEEVISEAKGLGIETMTPDEVQNMLSLERSSR